MLHTVDSAQAQAAPSQTKPAPETTPSSPVLRGMSFDAASSALAPVQMKGAPAGQLSSAQVASAVRYNKGRHLSAAQWRSIQKTVGSGADGVVGPNTVRAVARWQASHGLSADGMVGPATLGKLNAGGGGGNAGGGNAGGGHATLTSSQVNAAVHYNKGRGFSRATVQTIQGKVGSAADGVFGPNTVRAIANWQRSHGLTADGKVGPATAGKMGVKAGGGGGAPVGGSNSQKLAYAKSHAKAIGLRITSTTGGKHAPGSYHYAGRAIDVAGSASKMAQYYWDLHKMHPTELFYDPCGGVKHGKDIGAIGGHRDHVHVAF